MRSTQGPLYDELWRTQSDDIQRLLVSNLEGCRTTLDLGYGGCLRLPGDLRISKRNAALLLMIAGVAATFPRDRQEAGRLFDYLRGKRNTASIRALRLLLDLGLRLPGGRGPEKHPPHNALTSP